MNKQFLMLVMKYVWHGVYEFHYTYDTHFTTHQTVWDKYSYIFSKYNYKPFISHPSFDNFLNKLDSKTLVRLISDIKVQYKKYKDDNKSNNT